MGGDLGHHEGLQQTPLKIFVVDDNKLIVDTYRQLLSSPTRDIRVAPTVAAASVNIQDWQRNAANRPDVVILDWSLNGVDNAGMEVLREIRQAERTMRQAVPVMIVTSEPERVEMGFGAEISRLNRETYGRDIRTPVITKGEVDPIEELIARAESRRVAAAPR